MQSHAVVRLFVRNANCAAKHSNTPTLLLQWSFSCTVLTCHDINKEAGESNIWRKCAESGVAGSVSFECSAHNPSHFDTNSIVSAKCAKIFHDQQAEGDWHAGAAEMRARAEWLKISKGHDVVIGTRLIDVSYLEFGIMLRALPRRLKLSDLLRCSQGMANIVDTFCPCDITPAGFRNSLFALLASICVRPTVRACALPVVVASLSNPNCLY